MNKWIEFVRAFAKKNNISYACAVSTPECKEEYRAKYGNRKKLPMKKEREMMGAEDINRDEIVIYPKKSITKKKKPKVVESMEMEDINRLLPKGKIEKSKILEKIGEMKSKKNMGKEDVNRASKVYKISSKDKEGLIRFFEEHFEESDSDSDSDSDSSVTTDNPVSIEVEDAKTGKTAEYFEKDYRKLMTMRRIKEDDKLFLLAKFLSRKKLLKLEPL